MKWVPTSWTHVTIMWNVEYEKYLKLKEIAIAGYVKKCGCYLSSILILWFWIFFTTVCPRSLDPFLVNIQINKLNIRLIGRIVYFHRYLHKREQSFYMLNNKNGPTTSTLLCLLGKPKKKFCFSCPATKRVGGKGLATKKLKKYHFLTF